VTTPETEERRIRNGTRDAVIQGCLRLASTFLRRPELADTVQIEARWKPVDDTELRDLLVAHDEFWEFDPTEATLTRNVDYFSHRVDMVIDVGALALADVLAILDDTKPEW